MQNLLQNTLIVYLLTNGLLFSYLKNKLDGRVGFSIKIGGLVALFCLTTQPYAKPIKHCMDEWACFEKSEEDKHVGYWLINQKPFVVTMTLEVKSRNLTSKNSRGNKHIVTKVLQGNQRVKVLDLQPLNSNRRIWSEEDFYWAPGNMYAVHQTNVQYQYPYASGDYFRIVQGFGGGFSHSGASKYAIDFAMPIGTPIHAARAGQVIDLVEHHERGGSSRKFAQYANFVVVLHDDDTTGEYYHLRKNGVSVSIGDKVSAGQKLGYSGNTGFSSLPHLHFAVYKAKAYGKYQSLPFTFQSK